MGQRSVWTKRPRDETKASGEEITKNEYKISFYTVACHVHSLDSHNNKASGTLAISLSIGETNNKLIKILYFLVTGNDFKVVASPGTKDMNVKTNYFGDSLIFSLSIHSAFVCKVQDYSVTIVIPARK